MSMYKKATYILKGIPGVAMLQHNGRLADKSNKIAKERGKIMSKHKKTDEDTEEIARLSFLGGMYVRDGKPFVPGEQIEAVVRDAAKKTRMGKQVQAGIIADDSEYFKYDGPSDPLKRWEDETCRHSAMGIIDKKRVSITRPLFSNWEAKITINYLPDQISKAQLDDIMVTAGRVVGIGDWRPRYGRFEVQTA